MSIQQSMSDKIKSKNPEFANLLLNLLIEVDKNKVPKSRLKDELLEELTEWVIEEETN